MGGRKRFRGEWVEGQNKEDANLYTLSRMDGFDGGGLELHGVNRKMRSKATIVI